MLHSFLKRLPDKAKTVRVRIKLLKECTFGEHFLVVGDDPILGLWDPSEGVPLDWSEGHVWTAEVVRICGFWIVITLVLHQDFDVLSFIYLLTNRTYQSVK